MPKEVVVDGKTYEVPENIAQDIESFLSEAAMKPTEVNGVDIGIIDLLEELKTANWERLIPDLRTRQLLDLALYVDGYELHECAAVLTSCTMDTFDGANITVGELDPADILKVIRSGDF